MDIIEVRGWVAVVVDLIEGAAVVYLCAQSVRIYRLVAGTQRELRRAIHSLKSPPGC